VGCGVLFLALAPSARYDPDHETEFRNVIKQIEETHGESERSDDAGDSKSAE